MDVYGTSGTGTALLTTAYLPPASFFRIAGMHGKVRIEHHEHFQKQSLRSRCYILTANGPQALVVPVVHAARELPIGEAEISYKTPWPRLHWRTLTASYNRSPFFEHYGDRLREIIFSEPRLLTALNESLFRLLLEFAGLKVSLEHTGAYAGSGGHTDFRFLSDRTGHEKPVPGQPGESYPQVFSAKFGFTGGLSFLDLLCNTGPGVRTYLESVHVPGHEE